MTTKLLRPYGAFTLFDWFLAALGLTGFLLFLVMAASGCTVGRLNSTDPTGGKTSLTCYTVAWPWLDTSRQMDRASLASATNKTSLTLTGYNESETVSSNAAAMLNAAVGAAVNAAVRAVKP